MTDISREALRADIADILEIAPADLADDANLMDAGLDSMRAMNLAAQWEERGLPLDFADLGEAQTLAEIHALAQARQGQAPA
ncbi:phosphopantetheine-binding protein [Pelagerythrobacter marinus]|uniref:phosphopantetheine-binding protein n=1 Tax=Pelagerythrobacter marinus TaxID=538382 RepID=UPI002036C9B3|nr:phosphopantetheine-binding protein [Pelagerythrobacter marinus]USA40472.1 phosphopantetheine-binding protein [Pelagerythrobacter marinus]WPZ08358.1 phosphopantetheine-binding protein [Pelagerythrobacter marinus]